MIEPWLASCCPRGALPICATLLVLLGLMLLTDPARGQPNGPTLSVTLAPGCPDQGVFFSRVRALAGERAALAAGHVHIEAEDTAGYELRVTMPGATRELHSESCHELVESAAVIVALGVGAAQDAQAEEAHSAPEPLRAQPRDIAHDEVAAKRPRELRVGLWLELTAVHGLAPALAGKPSLGLSVRVGRLGAALAADYALPRSTAGSEGVRVQAAGASALLSYDMHARIRAALGLDMHLLMGKGRGLSEVRGGAFPLWAGRLELLFLPFLRSRHGLGVVLSAALPVVRHRFYIRDGGTAYRPPAYQLAGGMRWTFDALVRP